MDDVNNPNNQVVTQPGVETETTQDPSTGTETQTDGVQADSNPQGKQKATEPSVADLQKQIDNLNKALQFERKRSRGGRSQEKGYEVEEDLLSNPEFQKVALENATYKLKEGAKQIVDQYPNLPKQVANAILRNPRGWVNEGTTDITSALYDIEDNVISYLEELEQEQATGNTSQPKQFTVAKTNTAGGSEKDITAELQAIADIPPEDWTPEQEKMVNEYLATQRKKK